MIIEFIPFEKAEGVHPNGEKWRGMTVCKLHHGKNYLINSILDNLPNIENKLQKDVFKAILENMELTETTIAVVKCSVEDEFKEEIGNQIAYERAQKKFKKTVLKKINETNSTLLCLAAKLSSLVSSD